MSLFSPVKWLTDPAYRALPVQERALAWAASYVGQKEQGNNAGPFVTMLLKAIGLGSGYAWCAAFASWCLVKAGFVGGPKLGRGAVRNWARWADRAGLVRFDPKRGDLFFWLNPNGTGHIGFVTKVIGGPSKSFESIEGNTNAAGSREGDGVYRKVRQTLGEGRTIKFIRWYV